MTEPRHLEGLNPEQREAVLCTEGPLLILAGAGSGKTRVLTRRVAHLVHLGVSPLAILAVTFTNKAAEEMRGRVQDLVGEDARWIRVSTFHSACARFLRRDAGILGYRPNFAIYDDEDSIRLLQQIVRELGVDPKQYPPRAYAALVDRAKNRMQDPDEATRPGGVAAGRGGGMHFGEAFRRYEASLRAANAMDFNDLVNRMVELLEGHEDVREAYRRRFRYLLVDEYQDTNHAQYRLVKALAEGGRNVAVVGDDDQSIYSFRGADIRNILDFELDFPEAKVVRLERNYRSTGHILKVASALVRHNHDRKEKTLWTDAPDGPRVRLMVSMDEEEEAERVVHEIDRQRREGRAAGDFAIFYRTNATSRPFEHVLSRQGIPYVVVGGRRFYERREVRDMVAYLRLVANPADDMALLRVVNVPPRGIGAATVTLLAARAVEDGVPLLTAARRFAAGETGRAATAVGRFVALLERLTTAALEVDPGHLVELAADESGYLEALRAEETPEADQRLENVASLARAGHAAAEEVLEDAGPLGPLQRFLEEAALTGQDDEIPSGGKVTLMTVHLAKGLEYPVVFVVGLTDGGFPHVRARDTPEDLEEERRLAYVAFTRARERLYLSRPRRRRLPGTGYWDDAEPSPFLLELPAEALDDPERSVRPAPAADRSGARVDPVAMLARLAEARQRAPAPTPGSRRSILVEDPDLFRRGVHVRHPLYGIGEIVGREGSDAFARLRVRFPHHGTRLFRLREARLEIVEGEE